MQFVTGTSRAWTHRDKIKTPQGEKWLTLGVKRSPFRTPINQVELLADAAWRRDNLNQLRENYRHAPAYQELMPHLERLYALEFTAMRDFNMASIEMLMDLLDVRVPWVWSSGMEPEGRQNGLLVDLLKKVSATHYLSGVGARQYFDPAPFLHAGIQVVWQDFHHPVYPQLHGPFVPYLSALDVLFNCGKDQSRKLLRSLP